MTASKNNAIHWPKAKKSPALTKVKLAWKKLSLRDDLGYLALLERSENWGESKKFAEHLGKFKTLNVLGMGGSGLGGRMLIEALAEKKEGIRFIFDSHPEPFQKILNSANETTGWLIVSKSGTTLETITQLMVVIDHLKKKNISVQNNVHVITEPTASPLKTWAVQNKIICLDHPLDVGGRFAVLSPVGMVPAAWSDIDIDQIQAGALAAKKNIDRILGLAAIILESFNKKKDVSVLWSYCHGLNQFMPWLQQLWAESLGKSPTVKSSTPLPSYGTCDQHSVLQQYMEGQKDKHVFIFRETGLKNSGPKINTTGFEQFDFVSGKTLGEVYLAESLATEKALMKAGRPVSVIEFESLNPKILGELIMGFEIIIGVLGQAMKINAFNQPGVEAGKIIAKDLLKKGF